MMAKKPDKTIARDPFEDMDWSPDMETAFDAAEEERPELESFISSESPLSSAPVGTLRGKGVWLLYSADVELAIDMAVSIGAQHIIYKTGHRGMFFVDAAQRVHDRIRTAGLTPFAWLHIYCDDPIAEAEVAIKSMQAGYEGIVFDIEDQASGKGLGAAALGRKVLETGTHPEQLYYTSYPNIWQHTDIPYREMNAFCRGGFMPQCYPTFQRTPRTVIKKWAYGEHARWSKEWGNMPPLYPVLAAYTDEHGEDQLTIQEFLEWAQMLIEFSPSFFSIYRAKTTNRDLWSVLGAMGEQTAVSIPRPPVVDSRPPLYAESRPQPAERPTYTPVEPVAAPTRISREPVAAMPELEPLPEQVVPSEPQHDYYIVTVNDTVRNLCERNGITREQFWKWNGHLWDDNGLPRDALYMREGWRVRVG